MNTPADAPSASLPNHTCPLCGGPNQCAPAAAGHTQVACWCTKVRISPQVLARIPPDLVNKACLCPNCAQAQDRAKQNRTGD